MSSPCLKKDTVTRCGATATLNNTYWQAPTTLSVESTCSLAVKMDPTLPEQRRNPICQVRWVSILKRNDAMMAKYPITSYIEIWWYRGHTIKLDYYEIDWILSRSPSPDPTPKLFVRRITSGWVGRRIKFRLFAAKISASTVSWFFSYLSNR